MENEKTIADIFLSINQLNRQKWNVLTEMKNLEFNNGSDSKEYIEWIQIYEMICSVQRKNLSRLTKEESKQIQELIIDFNPSIDEKDLLQLLRLENQSLILNRTLADIGNTRLILYNYTNDAVNSLTNFLSQIIKLSDQEESELVIDEESVNQYMVSDLMNILYQTVQELLAEDISMKEKEELLSFKYKLMFLSRTLETRALITKFSIPNYPNLTTNTEIQNTGLAVEEYIDGLDLSILSYIKKIMYKLNESLYTEKKEILLLDTVILRALLSLLNNKDFYENIIINRSEGLPSYIEEQIEMVMEIIEKAQNPQKDYQKQRKYFTI